MWIWCAAPRQVCAERVQHDWLDGVDSTNRHDARRRQLRWLDDELFEDREGETMADFEARVRAAA